MAGEGERCHEFEPPSSLRGFVRKIWTYADDRLAGLTAPAGDPEGQVSAFVAWLEGQKAEQGWSLDGLVRAEIEAASDDRPSPDRSPSEQRALQRRFADRVGVSPRMSPSAIAGPGSSCPASPPQAAKPTRPSPILRSPRASR